MPPTDHPRRLRLAAWLGPVVALVGLVTYFTLAVRVPFLRDTAIVNLALVLVGLGLSVWALWARRGFWRVTGTVLSLLFAGLLSFYVFSLSASLPDTAGVVAVGETAPPLSLSDHEGRVVSLADMAGSGVVVVFYRGFW